MTASLRRRVAPLLPAPAPSPRAGDGRPADSVDRSPEALAQLPRWRRRLTHPALLWVAAALAFAAGQLVLHFLFRAFGERPGTIPSAAAWGPALAAVLGYALVLLLERRSPHELTSRPLSHLGRGLVAGTVLACLVVGAIVLLGGIRIDGRAYGAYYEGVSGGWSLWGWTVLLVGVAPAVAQGLLLRGVVFRYAEQLLGTWGGLVVSAVAAGALSYGDEHVSGRSILGASVWGLLLAALYALTRSLWFVIGLHAAWHVVRGPVLGIRSAQDQEWSSLLLTSPTGSWADFWAGLEGSTVALVVGGAVAASAIWVVARRGLAVPPSWATGRRPAQEDR